MFSRGTPVFLPAITLAAAFVSEQITTRWAPNLSTARGTHFVASVHVFPVPGGPCSLNSLIPCKWEFFSTPSSDCCRARGLVDLRDHLVDIANLKLSLSS